jgi:hypothetical protein
MLHLLIYFEAPATSTSRIIGDVASAITLLVTITAMWYVNKAVNKVKPQVIQERQKSRSVLHHTKKRLTAHDFTLQLP